MCSPVVWCPQAKRTLQLPRPQHMSSVSTSVIHFSFFQAWSHGSHLMESLISCTEVCWGVSTGPCDPGSQRPPTRLAPFFSDSSSFSWGLMVAFQVLCHLMKGELLGQTLYIDWHWRGPVWTEKQCPSILTGTFIPPILGPGSPFLLPILGHISWPPCSGP